MHSGEITGISHLIRAQEIPFSFLNSNFTMTQNTMQQAININGFFSNPHSPQTSSPLYSNSTSDESEELQISIINERKQRRMISNRESARRSRMRKQRHVDELWSQVMRLKNENINLIDKLNNMSESHDRLVQQNACLREETSDLREMIGNMQLDYCPYDALRDLEDISCNSVHLRAESSSN